jgi:argininosuccinate lyase
MRLPDAFCTGSSIMPHKKNPDSLELTRGKSARVIGCLQQLFVLLKGLPLAYNRDLQEDKTALFDAFDAVNGMLAIAAPLVAGSSLKRESINARLEDGFLDATTLMEAFIKAGVPMRTAHEAVGTLVRTCEGKRCRLADLPNAEFEKYCPGIGPKLKDVPRRRQCRQGVSKLRQHGPGRSGQTTGLLENGIGSEGMTDLIAGFVRWDSSKRVRPSCSSSWPCRSNISRICRKR